MLCLCICFFGKSARTLPLHLWWPSTHSLSEFVGPQGCDSAFAAAIGWLGLGRESFEGGRTKIGAAGSLGGATTGVRTGGHSLNNIGMRCPTTTLEVE